MYLEYLGKKYTDSTVARKLVAIKGFFLFLVEEDIITVKPNENYEIDKWQFAIDTNDSKLREQLSLNTRVRVQYYYENEEMNKVESSFGYHSAQRENNIDIKTKNTRSPVRTFVFSPNIEKEQS